MAYINREAVVNPRSTAFGRYKFGIAKQFEVVRYRRLFERQPLGKVAYANGMFGAGQGREDREAVRIGKRLEENGVGGTVRRIERGGRARALYRHFSILAWAAFFEKAPAVLRVRDEKVLGRAKREQPPIRLPPRLDKIHFTAYNI